MIIDSLVFNNELNVLEVRLAELYDTVDYFVLVEANRTQTRLPKPYYYLDNKDRFAKWNDKIVSLQLEEFIPGGQADWKMENWQRQQILEGMDKLQKEKNLKLSYEDYLLVSDLDEIPMAGKLKEVIESKPDQPMSFNHYFNSYFADLYSPHRGWYGTVICPLALVGGGYSPQYLRSIKDNLPHIGEWDKEFFGWHLSAMGGFETVWNKAKYNIEPHEKWMLDGDKLKGEYEKLFNQHVLKEKFFMFLDDPSNFSIQMADLPWDKLPKYLIENREKFKSFFFPREEKQLQLI